MAPPWRGMTWHLQRRTRGREQKKHGACVWRVTRVEAEAAWRVQARGRVAESGRTYGSACRSVEAPFGLKFLRRPFFVVPDSMVVSVL